MRALKKRRISLERSNLTRKMGIIKVRTIYLQQTWNSCCFECYSLFVKIQVGILGKLSLLTQDVYLNPIKAKYFVFKS